MPNAADVLSRLQARSPAFGLPGDFYRDAGIYDLELDLVFYSRFVLSGDGQVRTTRLPLLPPAVSYTMSGRAAVRKQLSDAIGPQVNFGALLFFHYPSSWNHVLGDHAISFRVLPLSPTQTQLTTKWLVHRDAVEGVDYDVAELTRLQNGSQFR